MAHQLIRFLKRPDGGKATVSTSEPADMQSKFATPPNDTVAKRRSLSLQMQVR